MVINHLHPPGMILQVSSTGREQLARVAKSGVIILPIQTSCTFFWGGKCLKIIQNHHTFAVFDPPQIGGHLMTPAQTTWICTLKHPGEY